MDLEQVQSYFKPSRSMHELGVALVAASAILALFFFIPVAPEAPPPEIVTETPPAPDAFAAVALEAQAAIVYDLATGATLYAKNADAQLPLASLTKLLAVYAALTQFAPNAPITISEHAASLEAPRAFNEGQIFSLADLSRLTLTASLNDGAAAIVEATAEREGRTPSEVLARAAAELKLGQTYAVNGNGLDQSETVSGGYGSARDLARLAGALVLRAPSIALATAENSAEAVSEGGTAFSVQNTNPFVEDMPHLLLSKTGYTDLAGGNLALVFDIGIGHPIAVVVLGSSREARFTDSTVLIAATLAHFAGLAFL